jgi:L-ascorbate metabolism protein UlaG (beta-lactamase superfamily)
MAQADRAAGRWAGETATVEGVTITTVASIHWGGRYGIDGSVWGLPGYTGYVIEYHGMTVYYPGDTGYDPELFRSIGETYAIDLALIPIAPCYDPASLGTRYHVGPAGAVKILEDTRACAMVPIHYGTVHEPLDPFDALRVFLDLIKGRDDLRERVEILEIGEQSVFLW